MRGNRLLLAAILATLLVPEVAGPYSHDQLGLAFGHGLAWLIILALCLIVAALHDPPKMKDEL